MITFYCYDFCSEDVNKLAMCLLYKNKISKDREEKKASK